MKKHLNLTTGLLLVLSLKAGFARTGTAISNNNWNNTATWSFNDVPKCGDTLIIPSGKTVTVTSQENYATCTESMYITVGGKLQLTNGNKIDLPCNSCLNVLTGGEVKKFGPGTGTSTLISICGVTKWKAADGTLSGPVTLCSTLPISLLFFEAKPESDKVNINWVTASEINNDYFILEQSTDGKNFNEVSRVKGAGNSTEVKEYQCVDYFPIHGISYYRLKQIDFDGQFTYSDVIATFIKSKAPFDFISVETTINSTIRLMFSTKHNEVCNLQVFELSGAPVFNLDMNVNAGLNKKEIYCPFLKKGIYILTISNAEQVLSKKISLIE